MNHAKSVSEKVEKTFLQPPRALIWSYMKF